MTKTTRTISAFFRLRPFFTWLLLPAILAGFVLAQARAFRISTCETFDEFTYLRMGIFLYKHQDFKRLASPMCPPLPILLEYAWPGITAKTEQDTPGWDDEVPGLIRQARFSTSLLVGCPLVWAVYAWLMRRRGLAIGALAGMLTALSPTVLAAASIATTDACFALFAIIALAALNVYQSRPSLGSLLAAGIAMGLAMASKQSALFLFPVALLEMAVNWPQRRPDATRTDAALRGLFIVGLRISALVVLTFLVDETLYGFSLATSFQNGSTHMRIPLIIPMVLDLFPNGEALMDRVRQMSPPLALDTFAGQVDHATTGHLAFLMGMRSLYGWWYYFPVAIALKSTPAELVMFAIAAVLALRPRNWADTSRRLWLSSLIVMIGLGVASKINIGQRYMLVTYPIVILLAADLLGSSRTHWPRQVLLAGTVLIAWQGISAIMIAPHYLCYFNSFCGGPFQGYRYLADSNLDWGQDIPVLREALEARGYRKVALSYFGTARPEVYGLRYVDSNTTDENALNECDWLAISATRLQGVYSGSSTLIDRYGKLPCIRAGYTFFLYDLKDPRVRDALRSTRDL